jgi:5-formyltetrahydrofolate cyclo-ligase
MNKTEVRKIFKAKRKALSALEIKEFSEAIQSETIRFLDNHPDIQHIHVFLPIKKLQEVDTIPLIKHLLDKNYILYTSKIDDLGLMQTLLLKDLDNLSEDPWGIPIPTEIIEVSPEPIEMVLIPLLSFDERGYRIGYGKGYYDTFLKNIGSSVKKVGLSFFTPLEILPIEPHDEKMDVCITPKKTFFFD